MPWFCCHSAVQPYSCETCNTLKDSLQTEKDKNAKLESEKNSLREMFSECDHVHVATIYELSGQLEKFRSIVARLESQIKELTFAKSAAENRLLHVECKNDTLRSDETPDRQMSGVQGGIECALCLQSYDANSFSARRCGHAICTKCVCLVRDKPCAFCRDPSGDPFFPLIFP
jgi:hypothetical protein